MDPTIQAPKGPPRTARSAPLLSAGPPALSDRRQDREGADHAIDHAARAVAEAREALEGVAAVSREGAPGQAARHSGSRWALPVSAT